MWTSIFMTFGLDKLIFIIKKANYAFNTIFYTFNIKKANKIILFSWRFYSHTKHASWCSSINKSVHFCWEKCNKRNKSCCVVAGVCVHLHHSSSIRTHYYSARQCTTNQIPCQPTPWIVVPVVWRASLPVLQAPREGATPRVPAEEAP